MSACTETINTVLSSQDNFNRWKSETDRKLNAASTTSELASLEAEVFATTGCLQEKIANQNRVASDISTRQANILRLQDSLQDQQETIQISKDRLSYLKDPEMHVSYYQSWFPMGRPMKEITVPILIGLSVFMTIASFGYLLFLGNIHFILRTPPASPDSPLARIFAQFTPAFWLLFATSTGVIIYLTKKN